MAMIPFRVSGPAADVSLEERIIQIGCYTLVIKQDLADSGSSRVAQSQPSSLIIPEAELNEDQSDRPVAARSAADDAAASAQLQNVGKVVWQSGFLLADFLIQHSPFGEWTGVKVLDLGTGTGIVGIALAKAGALVTLSDLPHVTPLTDHNVAANGLSMMSCKVVNHRWGEPTKVLGELPDVITGGDLIYAPEHHDALLDTLGQASAAHTQLFLAFRLRGATDMAFEDKLKAKGFAVNNIPSGMFHQEYRQQAFQGALSYCILQAAKL